MKIHSLQNDRRVYTCSFFNRRICNILKAAGSAGKHEVFVTLTQLIVDAMAVSPLSHRTDTDHDSGYDQLRTKVTAKGSV